MTSGWSKLAGVVNDFNEVAFTQRGYLIASETRERECLPIRADCGYTNSERSVVTRPFETCNTAADSCVSCGRKTIRQPARKNDRFIAVSDVAELGAFELAVVSGDRDETRTREGIYLGFRKRRSEGAIQRARFRIARERDAKNEPWVIARAVRGAWNFNAFQLV